MAIGSDAISFHLLNPDGNAVLGIFDGRGQTSKLDIRNTSRQDWQLRTVNSEVPTENDHHFELKFRPGTLNLSATTLITVEAGDAGWKISKPTPTGDGVSLYLLSTNPITVKKDTSTFLTLHNLSADASGGSRGTRVELKWGMDRLEYAGGSKVSAGNRVRHLSIVNERGEQQLPVLMSFVGTDKVLNEAATGNTLKLRMANLLKQGSIQLYPEGDTEPASKFTVWFDVSDNASDNVWALASKSSLSGKVQIAAEIKVGAETIKFLPGEDKESPSPSWWITPSKRVSIGPNQFIEVTLSNIITSYPPGKTNLYIKYENVPGYRDGSFVSVIEKSAAVYKGQNLGLGTPNPETRLHLKGDLRVENNLLIDGPGTLRMKSTTEADTRFQVNSNGNVGVGTGNPERHLHVRGAGDQEIMIQSTDEGGAQWTLQSSKGAAGGRFEIINRNIPKGHLAILKDGNVGIGTAEPQEKLHVAGNLRINSEQEIFFEENGQIRSHDNNHRILFRRSDNILELREFGKIVFSPGALLGKETAKVVMAWDGNVGIGTTDPKKHLHVYGEGDQEVLIESKDNVQWSLQSCTGARNGRFEIINRTAGQNRFTILKDGNAGIGTEDPQKHLHVKGASDQEIMIESEDTNGVKWTLQSSAGERNGRFEIVNRTAGKNCFTILKDGKVGIGTVTPSKGVLHVSGHVDASVSGFGYLNKESTGFPGNRQDCPYSIWADDRSAALEFNAHSDERMKNIQGRSNSAADLAMLLGIEITDYSFRDVIGKGTGTSKKVIGQQIEKVFPQAVTKQTNVVPDIYEQASIRDGWVALATNLKKGEHVKLITEKGEAVHEVLEVTPDKFRIAIEHDGDNVFVFGREVDDFLTVDYDAIAMLNVSATQQLKKELDHEVKALRAENVELRAANDTLAKRLQLLESRLEASLSVAAARNGSNGNGRH